MKRSYAQVLLILSFALAASSQTMQVVRVSSASSTDPEEVSIAINPANPQILAAGANITYYYRSTDGGKTWRQSNLPRGAWGDPCLIFDASGNLYYAHLTNSSGTMPYAMFQGGPQGVRGRGLCPDYGMAYFIDRLTIHRSLNAGVSWTDSVEVGYRPPRAGQDKEWLAVDMTGSPYRGSIYMSWTEFDSYASTAKTDSTRIRFSRSTNNGKTWSAPLYISDKNGNSVDSSNCVEGAVPCVGPNGEVYVAWEGPAGLVMDKSINGGATFGKDVFVDNPPGGWCFNIAGLGRANGMPIICCDVSTSPYRGNVYICWSDLRNGTSNPDIFFIKSTNGGQTWGSVKKVNNDATTRPQFFPWMCIDQATGAIYIVFYDRRSTTGNATEVYVARSIDGGETFENLKIDTPVFTPITSIFLGDYLNIAALNGKVYPIWARLDGSSLSVWTAIITYPVGTESRAPRLPTIDRIEQAGQAIRVTYTAASPQQVSIALNSLSGRTVLPARARQASAGTHTETYSTKQCAPGMYVVTLRSGNRSVTRQVMVSR